MYEVPLLRFAGPPIVQRRVSNMIACRRRRFDHASHRPRVRLEPARRAGAAGISSFDFGSRETLSKTIPSANGLFTARSLAHVRGARQRRRDDGVRLLSRATPHARRNAGRRGALGDPDDMRAARLARSPPHTSSVPPTVTSASAAPALGRAQPQARGRPHRQQRMARFGDHASCAWAGQRWCDRRRRAVASSRRRSAAARRTRATASDGNQRARGQRPTKSSERSAKSMTGAQ
jgi:hypothetical protein